MNQTRKNVSMFKSDQNIPGATAVQTGTANTAELCGQVYINMIDMPTDGLFTDQWYLNDINVLPVWKDAYGEGYTGKGIKIAQFELGMHFSTDYDFDEVDARATVRKSLGAKSRRWRDGDCANGEWRMSA